MISIYRVFNEHDFIYFHIITNAGEDDLTSQPVGNAGKRLACGEIFQRVGEVIALLIWYLLELNVCTVKKFYKRWH